MIPTGFTYLQSTYLHIPTKRFADVSLPVYSPAGEARDQSLDDARSLGLTQSTTRQPDGCSETGESEREN